MPISKQTELVIKRWLFILFVGLLAAIAGCVIIGLLPVIRECGNEMCGRLSLVIQWGLFVFAITIAIRTLFRFYPTSWGQLRFLHLYPPLWVGVTLGGAAAALVNVSWYANAPAPALTWSELGQFLLVLSGAIVVNWGFTWTSSSQEKESKSSSGCAPTKEKKPFFDDWTAFKEWFLEEAPSAEDVLGRGPIIRRIAEQLSLPMGQDKTIGLVGGFGSGKSTIVKLLAEQIKKNRKEGNPLVWICEASCWGFDDSGSAIRHILTSITKKIEEHVDCSLLRGMPDAYRKAISIAGDSKHLIDAVMPETDPEEQFGRLSMILQTVNARVVVAVEDLDRNDSKKFDRQEVMALLQRLKSVYGVSFILTGGGQPLSKIEFAKLCDHIDPIPALNPHDVQNAVRRFREECRAEYPDVYPPEESEAGPLCDPRYRITQVGEYPRTYLPAGAAAVFLLATPRTLKHVLRQTKLNWDKLHGEVNFDDLFVVNVLRHGASGAFDFLVNMLPVLRANRQGASSAADEKWLTVQKEAVQTGWKAASDSADWDPEMARRLIVFLVPVSQRFWRECITS